MSKDNVDINELHPIVKEKLLELRKTAHTKHGIQFKVTSGYRDQREQNALYAKGRTAVSRGRGESIVTNVRYPYSFHNHRVAFDIVPIVNDQPVWNNEDMWIRLGAIGRNIGFSWGGDWKMVDKPHFQYTQGLTIHDFISGKNLKQVNTSEDISAPAEWARENWMKAKAKGVLSENSMPNDQLTKQELMEFFGRMGLLD